MTAAQAAGSGDFSLRMHNCTGKFSGGRAFGADSELKLESARPGVISSHIFSRANNSGKPEVFFAVSTKQQSRLRYSHVQSDVYFS